MAKFPYSPDQIRQIIAAKKVIGGTKLDYKEYDQGEGSKQAKTELYSDETGLASMTFVIWAGSFRDPETFHAVFLVDNERVRGIDFEKTAIRKGYKKVVPAGWHQNKVDPNDPSWEGNKHEPVDLGVINGLEDFARKVSKEWNIEPWEQQEQLSFDEN